jgi:hypothetical protein
MRMFGGRSGAAAAGFGSPIEVARAPQAPDENRGRLAHGLLLQGTMGFYEAALTVAVLPAVVGLIATSVVIGRARLARSFALKEALDADLARPERATPSRNVPIRWVKKPRCTLIASAPLASNAA